MTLSDWFFLLTHSIGVAVLVKWGLHLVYRFVMGRWLADDATRLLDRYECPVCNPPRPARARSLIRAPHNPELN